MGSVDVNVPPSWKRGQSLKLKLSNGNEVAVAVPDDVSAGESFAWTMPKEAKKATPSKKGTAASLTVKLNFPLEGCAPSVGIGLGLDDSNVVTEVKPGTPAEAAGLAVGDRVLVVDGTALDGRPMAQVVRAADTHVLEVERGGELAQKSPRKASLSRQGSPRASPPAKEISVEIAVPSTWKRGQSLKVKLSDGREVAVKVPDDKKPGDSFTWTVMAAAPGAATKLGLARSSTLRRLSFSAKDTAVQQAIVAAEKAALDEAQEEAQATGASLQERRDEAAAAAAKQKAAEEEAAEAEAEAAKADAEAAEAKAGAAEAATAQAAAEQEAAAAVAKQMASAAVSTAVTKVANAAETDAAEETEAAAASAEAGTAAEAAKQQAEAEAAAVATKAKMDAAQAAAAAALQKAERKRAEAKKVKAAAAEQAAAAAEKAAALAAAEEVAAAAATQAAEAASSVSEKMTQ